MVTTERRQAGFLSARRPTSRRAVVGVDGGGTKTQAVILDANSAILGEGLAGASNPLRVGIAAAAMAMKALSWRISIVVAWSGRVDRVIPIIRDGYCNNKIF